MNITTFDNKAVWTQELTSGGTIEFQARDITRERTGLHAHLAILCRSVIVAHSYFNLLRDEERTRICNSAHTLFLPADKEACTKETLRHDLGLFALGLDDWLETQWKPEAVAGRHSDAPGFWINPYIMKGNSGTILYAPPGKGKSWIALAMAVSVDSGSTNLWQVEQGTTMFVNLERSKESLERRLAQVNDALHLPSVRPLLMMNMRGKSLRDAGISMRRAVKDHQVRVVFLDSISRSGMGKMNEDSTANAIIDTLNGLDVSWLAIGHTPRADDHHLYGSQMFDAGEDIGIRLISARKDGVMGVGLEVTKANDMPKPDLTVFALDFNAFALSGIRPSSIRDFPQMAAVQERTLADAVVDYLAIAGLADATTIAEEIGRPKERANVSRLLSNSPLFLRNPQKDGKLVLYRLGPRPEETAFQDQEPPF